MRFSTGGGGGNGGRLQLPVATLSRSFLRIPTAAEGGSPYAAPVNQDDLASAFSVGLTPGRSLDAGQVLTDPAFAASYSAAPLVSAVLTDNYGSAPRDLLNAALRTGAAASDSETGCHALGSFVRSTPNQSVTWVVSANAGGSTHSATATATWMARLYWGVLTPAQLAADDATIAAAVAAQTSRLQTSRGGTYVMNPGGSDYGVLWVPTFMGTPAFQATVNGTLNLPGGVSLVRSFSITNAYGVAVAGGLYRTDAVGLAASWAVT